MKKALFIPMIGLLGALALISLPSYASQKAIRTITIINHFNDTLDFNVNLNRDVVPDLTERFSLSQGAKVTSRVLTDRPADQSVAYIAATGVQDPQNTQAYWGVDSKEVHEYIKNGLAFSWDDHQLMTLILCTNEEYDMKGHC